MPKLWYIVGLLDKLREGIEADELEILRIIWFATSESDEWLKRGQRF